MPKVGKYRLPVQWNRVISHRGYLRVTQFLLQVITLFRQNRVLGVNRGIPILDLRDLHGAAFEEPGIAPTDFLPQLHLLFKNLHLRQDHRSLHRIESTVHSEDGMVISTGLSVEMNPAHLLGQLVVVRENRATIAVAAEGFGRKKGGAPDHAQSAGSVSMMGR